jgi:hypothetical protein
MKPASNQVLSAAKACGWRFECVFKYYPERMEGVSWKWGSGDPSPPPAL